MKWYFTYFCIDSVPIVFGSYSPVLYLNLCSFKLVHFHKFEERLIAEHRRNLKLVLVPVLREACLDVTLAHVKGLPVDLCALVANEDTKSNVEHGAGIV